MGEEDYIYISSTEHSFHCKLINKNEHQQPFLSFASHSHKDWAGLSAQLQLNGDAHETEINDAFKAYCELAVLVPSALRSFWKSIFFLFNPLTSVWHSTRVRAMWAARWLRLEMLGTTLRLLLLSSIGAQLRLISSTTGFCAGKPTNFHLTHSASFLLSCVCLTCCFVFVFCFLFLSFEQMWVQQMRAVEQQAVRAGRGRHGSTRGRDSSNSFADDFQL